MENITELAKDNGEILHQQENLQNGTSNIYIIFTSTLTGIGRIIRAVTKHKYNHTSISFDPHIEKMYSFARYNVNAPLVSGFIEESPLRYYFENNDKSVLIKMYKIPLEKEIYDALKNFIKEVKLHRDEYLYNSLSMVGAIFHKKIIVEKAYTCIEFATMLLKKFGIADFDDNKYYSIEDVENLLEPYLFYEGEMLSNVINKTWGDDKFYYRVSGGKVVFNTFKFSKEVLRRKLFKGKIKIPKK